MKTIIKNFLVVSFPIFFSLQAFSADRESQILFSEFDKLYNYVVNLEPDGKVDDFLNYKVMNGYEILWDLETQGNSYDIITLYRESKNDEDEFTVTFYRSKWIVEGRTVVRRFIGPVVTNWRNDTADVESGEYFGTQGNPYPHITKQDQGILNDWNIIPNL